MNTTNYKNRFTYVMGFLFFLCVLIGATPSFAITINFDDLDEGAIIGEQYAGLGIHISAQSNRHDAPNAAMAFNSNDYTGGDDDLQAGAGMIMIISEDMDSGDPDDEARGGRFFLDFDFDVGSGAVSFWDIEESGGSLVFYNNGIEVFEEALSITGNNQGGTEFFSGFTFDHIEITLTGSGSVTDFTVNPVPEPATMMLLGIGLLGLAGIRRKIS